MSTSPTSSPLKVLGKESLMDDNLLISNYNPYDSRNTSGISGLATARDIQAKLYILDKTCFKEPTPAEFRTVKTIGNIVSFFKLVPTAVPNYFDVTINTTYDTTDSFNPKRKLLINNVNLSIDPTIAAEQTIDNFLDSFGILVFTDSVSDSYHKTYADITSVEQIFMWLIPSEQINMAVDQIIDPSKFINIEIGGPLDKSLILNNFNIELVKGDIPTKLYPNKLNSRIREELFTGLVVKPSQTLKASNELIKFKDPITGVVNPLTELINAVAIGKPEKLFIDWIVALSKDNNLDNYNKHLYNIYGLNTLRTYDILIPEIIFNLLADGNMFNVNLDILNGYFTTNPPASYGIDTSGVDFNIENSLKVFSGYKSKASILTPVTYDVNGIVLPKFNAFNNCKVQVDVLGLFLPQRTIKVGTQDYGYVNYNYDVYMSTSGCNQEPILNAPNTDEQYLNDYLAMFEWFISPTGSNSNDGKTKDTPKLNFTDIPAGSSVCMLPGIYSGYTIKNLYGFPAAYLNVFIGFNNHKAYGCGKQTIIEHNDIIPYASARDKPRCGSIIGEIHNLKIIYDAESTRTANYSCAIQNGGVITCYGVVFEITGVYSLAYNTGSITLNNCTFNGGTRITNYFSGTSYINNDTGFTLSTIDTKTISFRTKALKALKATTKFSPKYTLLPITDDEAPDANSIILERNRNFTAISNFSYNIG